MEVRVIRRFFPELISAVGSCVQNISDYCFSRSLIGETKRKEVLESAGTDDDKARILILAVLATVERNPTCFQTFIDILENTLPQGVEDSLLKTIKEAVDGETELSHIPPLLKSAQLVPQNNLSDSITPNSVTFQLQKPLEATSSYSLHETEPRTEHPLEQCQDSEISAVSIENEGMSLNMHKVVSSESQHSDTSIDDHNCKVEEVCKLMQVGTYSDSNDGIALSVVQVESDQAQCLVTSHCEELADISHSTKGTQTEYTKSNFESLDSMRSTKHKIENLEHVMHVDIRKIKNCFVHLQTEVEKSLRKVPLGDIKSHIRRYVQEFDPESDKEVKLLSEENLHHAASIDQLFAICLEKRWNFFDCDMLINIVEQFGDETIRTKVKVYHNHLKEFFEKRKLSEVPEHLSLSCCTYEGYEQVVMKLDLNDPILREIKNLKSRICEILEIMPSTLLISDIRQGCIEITFLIPVHISEYIFGKPITDAQREALKAASVLKFTWRNKTEMFVEKTYLEYILGYHDDTKSSKVTQSELSMIRSKMYTLDNLFDVCEDGDIIEIRRAIANGVDPKQAGDHFIKGVGTSIGVTPLHVACCRGHLEVVQFLIEVKYCNPEAKDRGEQTPLHLAASGGHLEIVHFLVERKYCSPEAKNKYGETPLHLAASESHLKMVQFLVEGEHCNPEAKNKDGETPLHYAARRGHLEVVQFLVKYCNPEAKDRGEQTPLHLAASGGHLKMVHFLVERKYCSPETKNKYGETPMHLAASEGHLKVVQFLVECNPEAKNKDGETPLHYAARGDHLEIIQFLVEGRYCNPEAQDNYKATPLHLAASEGHLEMVQFLVEGKYCNPEAKNKDGETPLHKAALWGNLEVVQFLVEGQHCNPEAKNKDGETLLHHAVRNDGLELVQFLINGKYCNPDSRDKDGQTPLHSAIRGYKKSAIVSCLLQDGQCDPNSVAYDGRTPLDITNNPQLIRLLLNYGAKPFPARLQDSPADADIKMFFLGNPGVGKSTLVKALSIKGSRFSRIKHRFTKVIDVDEKTAGIIPHDIQSEALGRVTMYDFAGHQEFYAGHDALLHNSMKGSPSIIILVFDMSKEEEKIRETVQYWLQFISNHCASIKEGPNPYLVTIGSHAEKVSTSERKLKSKLIESSVKGHGLDDNFIFVDHVNLDCRYAESSSMSHLRSLLSRSCKSFRSSKEMAIALRSFLVFLLDEFREKVAVTYGEAQTALMNNLHSDKHVYLEFVKSFDPLEMCEKLNERGNIMFLKNQECLDNSWLILDKAILLSQINGVIFAPEGFKEHHHNLSTNTGVVPVSKLTTVFPDLNSDMITQFLCHLEFCHEVTDQEILSLLQANSDTPERFLFFPGLVDLDTPPDVWQPSDHFGYHSGWLLKCSSSEQFFSARFLQVLLLRLAYSLAFAPSSLDCQILPRSCRVWKRGISWSIRSGVEIIVEVIDQKQVMAVMRCFKSQTKAIVDLIKTRSAIIGNVLEVKKTLCSTVNVQEQLLHPECMVQYPPFATKRNPVSITEIAQTVIEGNACVLDESRALLELDTLLFFEPYANLGEQILQNFFDTVASQEITDEFIYRIAEKYDIAKCLLRKMENLIAILELTPSKIHVANPQHPPGDIHKLARVFKLWRDEMGKEGTIVNLRKKLDQFSVFAGRNPMELTDTHTSHSPRKQQTITSEASRESQSAKSVCTAISQSDESHNLHVETASSPVQDVRPKLDELHFLEGRDGHKIRVIQRVAPDWRFLAAVLGFDEARIKIIEKDYGRISIEEACQEMFIRWLNGEHDLKPLTWGTLIQCLTQAGLDDVARSLKKILTAK